MSTFEQVVWSLIVVTFAIGLMLVLWAIEKEGDDS